MPCISRKFKQNRSLSEFIHTEIDNIMVNFGVEDVFLNYYFNKTTSILSDGTVFSSAANALTSILETSNLSDFR